MPADDVDLDDEVLDEAEIAAVIAALRAARDAGYGDRQRHEVVRVRYRPGQGGYR